MAKCVSGIERYWECEDHVLGDPEFEESYDKYGNLDIRVVATLVKEVYTSPCGKKRTKDHSKYQTDDCRCHHFMHYVLWLLKVKKWANSEKIQKIMCEEIPWRGAMYDYYYDCDYIDDWQYYFITGDDKHLDDDNKADLALIKSLGIGL